MTTLRQQVAWWPYVEQGGQMIQPFSTVKHLVFRHSIQASSIAQLLSTSRTHITKKL
jgi:hypothetical protein